MRTRSRTFTAFLAIAAIAVASCLGPQIPYAAHHPAAAKIQKNAKHHAHDHDAASHDHDHHASGEADRGVADTGNGTDTRSKYCCSSTCTVSGYVTAAFVCADEPTAKSAATMLLDDVLRASHAGAIDPPPRTV